MAVARPRRVLRLVIAAVVCALVVWAVLRTSKRRSPPETPRDAHAREQHTPRWPWPLSAVFPRGTRRTRRPYVPLVRTAASETPFLGDGAVCRILDDFAPESRSESLSGGGGARRLRAGHSLFSTTAVRSVVVMDAGSTGTRVHVYDFAFCGARMLGLADELFEQVKPGLSAYAAEPKTAGLSLAPLVDAAARHVDPSRHAATPLVLKATAGLRLLGEDQAAAIIAAATAYLREHSPFRVEDVSVMDGAEEGVFAWATVNFLQGHLSPPRRDAARMLPPSGPAAVMDLGGGSTQIVFAVDGSLPVDTPAASRYYSLRLLGDTRRLYQHSYLQYGLMEARAAAKRAAVEAAALAGGAVHTLPFACFAHGHAEDVRHPLLPAPVRLVGTAPQWDACSAHVARLFRRGPDVPCEAPPCAFNGVHMPPLPGDAPIVAFSYFFDRLAAADVRSPATPADIAAAGTRLCAAPSASQAADNPEWCLDVAYIWALLAVGYGLPAERALVVCDRINDYETGWCLGAAIAVLDAAPGA